MLKRRILHKIASTIGICAMLLSSAVHLAQPCTGIRLTAQDGTVVPARTLEFGIDIHSDVLVVPRGYARTGTTPDAKEGLTWKTKYASVGPNVVGLPFLFDGMNEKGLAAGTFYFPASAGYIHHHSHGRAFDNPYRCPWHYG